MCDCNIHLSYCISGIGNGTVYWEEKKTNLYQNIVKSTIKKPKIF